MQDDEDAARYESTKSRDLCDLSGESFKRFTRIKC